MYIPILPGSVSRAGNDSITEGSVYRSGRTERGLMVGGSDHDAAGIEEEEGAATGLGSEGGASVMI